MTGTPSPGKSDAPWPYAVTPLSQELLSSFVCRCAHAHGETSMRFAGQHLGHALWTRDIDVALPALILDRLLRQSGLDLLAITAMQLDCRREWILDLGIYHRDRLRSATRYCPLCLEISAHWRKAWRLSLQAVCLAHQCELLERCPRCESALVLHRMHVIGACHRCGLRLHEARARAADRALSAAQALIEDFGQERRLLLGAAAQLVRSMSAQRQRLGLEISPELARMLPEHSPRRADLQASAAYLLLVQWLETDWPRRLLELAGKQRWTVQQVSSCAPTADRLPLLQVLEGALIVSPNRPPPGRREPMREKIRQLHERKEDGWREQRAKLLMAAAKRKMARGNRCSQ